MLISHVLDQVVSPSVDEVLIYSDNQILEGPFDEDSDNEAFVHQSKNKVGKITLFPNYIPHFTNTHEGDNERITIAFDLVTQNDTANTANDNYVRI